MYIIYRRNLCPEAGHVVWRLSPSPALPLRGAKVAEKVSWSLLPRESDLQAEFLGGKKASPSVTDLTINLQINAQVPKVCHPAWHMSCSKTTCRLISHLGGTAEGRLQGACGHACEGTRGTDGTTSSSEGTHRHPKG